MDEFSKQSFGQWAKGQSWDSLWVSFRSRMVVIGSGLESVGSSVCLESAPQNWMSNGGLSSSFIFLFIIYYLKQAMGAFPFT
jgi:hypothetical protein